MEAAIQRGRILREILKQNRLEPVSAIQNIAWLIAYNDGHLDKLPLNKVTHMLQTLWSHLSESNLSLTSPREDWSAKITQWIAIIQSDSNTPTP